MKRSKARRRRRTATAARKRRVDLDDILPEYDFRKGRRNKYAARFAQGATVVVLEPDVAATFPTDIEVNEALRALADIMDRRKRGRRATKRRTA